jgi:hypothetical protein
MLKVLSALLLALIILLPQTAQGRITPEDIVNEKRATFNQRVKNYSPQSKEKLEIWEKKIAQFNKEKTDILDDNMVRQALILEEYARRNPNENIEDARYWLTFAHEAVAFQAAKIHIFNLTSEKNINSDIISTITILQSELSTLRGKVIKSQKIISELVNT